MLEMRSARGTYLRSLAILILGSLGAPFPAANAVTGGGTTPAAKTFMQANTIPHSEYSTPSVSALATKVAEINACFNSGACATTPSGQLRLLPSYKEMRSSTPFTTGCYRRGTWISHLDANQSCPVDQFRVIVAYRMDCPAAQPTCSSHGSISFGCSYGKVLANGYVNYGDCYNGNAIIPEREEGPEDCPAGFEWVAAEKQCSPCKTGFYKPTTGTGACVPEPSGTGLNCAAGKEPNADGSACAACPGDTYKPTDGDGSCVACPAAPPITGGTATNKPNAGKTACVLSVSCGTPYIESPSGMDCITAASSCTPSTNATDPNSCAYKVANTCMGNDAGKGTCGEACGGGTKNCSTAQICPAGQEPYLTSCRNCPAGTYKSTSGNTSCTSCTVPYGTYFGGTPGATSPEGCGTVQCNSPYIVAHGACFPSCSSLTTSWHPDASGGPFSSKSAGESQCDSIYSSKATCRMRNFSGNVLVGLSLADESSFVHQRHDVTMKEKKAAGSLPPPSRDRFARS
jgi:hypothetical protein